MEKTESETKLQEKPESSITTPEHKEPIEVQRITSAPKETPSIFNRKKKTVVKEEEEPTKTASAILNKKEEAFEDEALQQAWKNFLVQRTDSADTDKLIMSRAIKKGEDHDIIISLSSQLEGSFLDKFETELIVYLRAELNNDHISLKREVSQVAEVNKLYTSKDIYDHMVQQNPALQELKDKLGLDFNY